MPSSASPLPPNLERIVERFKRRSNPKQRYEQLLWYAKKLEKLPEEMKTAENKVPGCVSQVFITADLKDGKVWYRGDSDAQLVKGLVALLIEGLNGLAPEEILRVTPDFIDEAGLKVSLTPSRANGFYNIFQTMKKKAIGFQLGMSERPRRETTGLPLTAEGSHSQAPPFQGGERVTSSALVE